MAFCRLLLFVGVGLGLPGCSSTDDGPAVLRIAPPAYSAAFDAAVEAARQEGMPAVLRDRRTGLIETDTRIAGSVLEPWRTDNRNLNQTMQNTLAFQRRRCRFEFTPLQTPHHAEFQPDGDANAESDAPQDLTQIDQDLELRVSVFVERAYAPGVRRSTWTRSKTTKTDLVWPEGQLGPNAERFWAPITRDPAYERRLLAKVQELLDRNVQNKLR